MATGRGEFFRSFLEGLERTLPGPGPGEGPGGGPEPGARQPGKGRGGHGRRQRGPDGGGRGRRRRKKPVMEAPRPALMETFKECKADSHMTSPRENFMERLPSEILMKILSHLDTSALFCISLVCKHLHRLANDSALWQKIYMSEFGGQTWKLKCAEEDEEDEEEEKEKLPSRWKRMYLWKMSGQEMSKWKKVLQDISPYTGLPQRTEWVLRSLNMSWELTVRTYLGQENTIQQSRVYFFESSMIICWSGGSFPKYHRIRSIQLHGVRRDLMKTRTRKWRSLLVKVDLKAWSGCFIGKDRLIKLMHLSPCFIVGVWRGKKSVAFIMVSLHFHRLVEKSLLGAPAYPYSEPSDRPLVDTSDPEFGLHGYTLHVTLHNTCTEIMSGHFHQLSCSTVQVQHGLLELKAVDRLNLSQHRSLSGNIKLPWRSEELDGSVDGCCILTLTLRDDFQKPFWCVSSPVCIRMAKKTPRFPDYCDVSRVPAST